MFYKAKSAVTDGDVKLGDGCSVWHNAVVRGDLAPIIIGAKTNVQDCCVLHVERDVPLTLGQGVTVGHGAILHSCDVGDNSLIGMGAIVLNKASIGKNCIIGAGALVTQGTVVPDGTMWFGSPARYVRDLTAAEINANAENAEEYVRLSRQYLTDDRDL